MLCSCFVTLFGPSKKFITILIHGSKLSGHKVVLVLTFKRPLLLGQFLLSLRTRSMLLASFISGDYQHASAEPASQWFDLKPFAAIALRQQVLTFLAPLSCVQRMPMSCCTSVCHDRQRHVSKPDSCRTRKDCHLNLLILPSAAERD